MVEPILNPRKGFGEIINLLLNEWIKIKMVWHVYQMPNHFIRTENQEVIAVLIQC